MKKALSLILALILCLSLCACGDNDTPETTKNTNAPTSTQDVPTKEDTPTTEDTTVADETTTSTESITISHPLVQDICCEWYTTPEGAPFQSLVINEDGTCVVDGVNATWKIEEQFTKDDALSIYIYIDGKACHGMLYFSGGDVAAVTEPTSDFPVFIPYEAHKN